MFRYDAAKVCDLLQVPNTCTTPMPEVALKSGQALLWYPGISLTDLRNSPVGKERMWQTNVWYDGKGFTAPPGYYAVDLRVPDSTNKNWSEQLISRPDGMAVAPIAVAATALLLHLKETGNDPLQNHWCRCAEEGAAQGYRTTLAVVGGRVGVGDNWDDYRFHYLWLAASWKF